MTVLYQYVMYVYIDVNMWQYVAIHHGFFRHCQQDFPIGVLTLFYGRYMWLAPAPIFIENEINNIITPMTKNL